MSHQPGRDERIRKEVEGAIRSAGIEVSVKEGAVFLTGTVELVSERDEAVKVASVVTGVRKVMQRIVVGPEIGAEASAKSTEFGTASAARFMTNPWFGPEEPPSI